MKLKWKVASAPTGRYRSFDTRAWPTADYEPGRPASCLYSESEYVPAIVKTGNHAEIKITIADYSVTNEAFKWRTLTKRGATIKEAKEIAEQFLSSHPELWPENNGK